MLEDVVRYLRCPHCGAELSTDNRVLVCGNRHTFDIARHGYVSLLPTGKRKTATGDTAAMVQARTDFLAAGHFAGLAGELALLAASALTTTSADGCVADVGAGTGYYLAAALDTLPGRAGLAMDASKFALRKAARAHPRIGAVGCDVWQHLPVADHAAAIVLNVFAPRNGPELHRILQRDGRLLVVTPGSGHLAELVTSLPVLTVDQRKDQRLAAQLSPYFDLVSRDEFLASLALGHKDVAAAVTMGPSAWHVAAGALAEAISRLPDPTPVTASVTLSVFQPSGRRQPR